MHAIAQTPDGYLWLGTEAGLARFDGVSFRVFDAANTPELRDSFVTALAVDTAGALHVGTDHGGVSRLDLGRFTNLGKADGLAGDRIRTLAAAADGSVWVAGYGGLSQLLGGKVMRTLAAAAGVVGDPVTSVVPEPGGTVWFGTVEGLFRLRDTTLERFGKAQGLHNEEVWFLYRAPDASLWVRAAGGPFQRFSGGKLTTPALGELPPADELRDLFVDRDGNAWIATAGAGLYRSRDGRTARFDARDGLSENQVAEILEDRDGSLWIGTIGGGVDRLRDGDFVTHGAREGLSADSVWSVLEDSAGDLWVGSLSGLDRLRDGQIRTITAKQGLAGDFALSLAEARGGGLWIGSNGAGLTRWNDGRAQRIVTPADGLPNGSVRSVLEDRRGDLWVGTVSAGLARFRGGDLKQRAVFRELTDLSINWLIEDAKGAIWAATDSGLNRIADGVITRFEGEVGLDVPVNALHEDAHGVLWIATSGAGLFRHVRGRFTKYTKRQGLPDDALYNVLEDAQEHLWVSSNKGVFRLDKSELDAVAAGSRRSVQPLLFGRSDGLRSPEGNGGNQPSAWRARDGRMWFATTGGVAVVDPARVLRGARAPRASIEGVRADGRALAFHTTRPQESSAGATKGSARPQQERQRSQARVPAGTRRVEIGFAAPSLVAPERTRFRYRLLGFEEDWVDAGTQRSAEYTNLAPGRYRFVVAASSERGDFRSVGTALGVFIEPRYFETGWFRALLAAAGALTLWALYRWRVDWLYARTAVLEERQRIAGEMHDSLAQGLSGVMLMIDAATLRMALAPDESQDHLRSARELARSSLDDARQSVWDLRTPLPEGQTLADALRTAAGLLVAGGPAVLEVRSAGAPWRLRADAENHLVRIAQEAVSNAIHHGRAQRIDIELAYARSGLTLEIRDNGGGFDPTKVKPQARRGFGTDSMRRRAQALGGTFNILSTQDQGTRVHVCAPRRPGLRARLRRLIARVPR